MNVCLLNSSYVTQMYTCKAMSQVNSLKKMVLIEDPLEERDSVRFTAKRRYQITCHHYPQRCWDWEKQSSGMSPVHLVRAQTYGNEGGRCYGSCSQLRNHWLGDIWLTLLIFNGKRTKSGSFQLLVKSYLFQVYCCYRGMVTKALRQKHPTSPNYT